MFRLTRRRWSGKINGIIRRTSLSGANCVSTSHDPSNKPIPFYLSLTAGAGLILIMLGAMQKKIFVWHIRFWASNGWH